MSNDARSVSGLSREEKRAFLARLLHERSAKPLQLPLSHAQQRLWFLDQLEPGAAAFNIWPAFRLQGELRPALLAASLREIVRRHQTLRTTFATVEGKPVQSVAPTAELRLPVVDLAALPEAHRWSEARRLVVRGGQDPFDLARGPLLRVQLLLLAPADAVILLAMHHIVSDGWSVGILLRELAALYTAGAAGRFSPLPELPVQYADFVHWQRSWLDGGALEEQLAYWRRQLAAAPAVLELPADRPRPAVQTFRGAMRRLLLSPELGGALAALGRRRRATPFMVLLAAFKALLHRHTGQDRIVVGSPIAGRNRRELEELIGFFINSLVLHTDLAGDPSFGELVERVREVALGAFAHQDIPFEKLVEVLQPERDASRTPLFQATFALRPPDPVLTLPGLALSPFAADTETAKLDLNLELWESAEGIAGFFEYNRDLFGAATVERLARHFEALLASVADEADAAGRSLSRLPLLAEGERHQLLAEWNDTARPCPQEPLVHDLFAAHAALRPQAVAVASPAARLTYGEVEERANRLAHHLRSLGVGPEVLVALCTERTLERVVGIVAVLKAGGAYVSLDPTYPRERLAFLLADGNAPVVLTERAFTGVLPESDAAVICLDTDLKALAGDGSRPPVGGATAESLAYVVYTSGSTGRPKGVEIPHAGLMNLVRWHQALYGVRPEDRGTQIASPAFDASIWELWPYLAAGASVHIPEAETRLSAPGMVRWWAQQGITLAYLMTPLAEGVLEAGVPPGLELPTRALIIGGDQLHRRPEPGTAFRLMNHYGPAEYTVTSTVVPVLPRGESEKTPSIGRPVDNTQIYILGRRMEPVPVGVLGELYVTGLGLARGYLRRPDLTAEKFLPDPWSAEPGARMYRTADLVRWLPDGDIDFLGRLDHQVKLRGLRIELGEIETVLAQHPEVREAVVIMREDRPREKRLAAYLVAAERRPTAEELRSFLKERLPEYMVPAAFVDLLALPLTPNGKVDRRALPAPDWGEGKAHVSAATATEERLAAIWAEVLEIPRVGVEDNFFDLGGHSLLTVRLQHRLREALALELSLVELFQNPTVRSLADHLDRRERGTPPALATRSAERGRSRDRHAGIAIIGMAGRFPGAPDVARFWRNLCDGVEAVTGFSEEEMLAQGIDPRLFRHPHFVNAFAPLDDSDLFDAGFFGFSPREAQVMDPQHRMFLECSWHALEDAGYGDTAGRGAVGVFAGANISYYLANLASDPELIASLGRQAVIGNDKDHLPTRVSYKLDLTGPSVNVQTACSTSLVAVHLACQSLVLGECDMALAGGVSLSVPVRCGYLYEEGGILSPDGHCRAFDAGARGTVGGNGVGVVVLKPLAAAVADGDSIYAVIRGTAINNDGSDKVGYTAPSATRQAAVIAEAQEMAGIAPETIGYIEAHGTGTHIGDPIEIAALTRVFRRSTEARGFCAVGAVKSNVGHLDSAAGVTGLIKAALAVRNGQVPASLHFESPNPEIDFASSPFFVNTRLQEWPLPGSPRRAGVSSFGLGGTNAHAVLEEAPPPAPGGPGRPCQLLVLSARSEGALDRLTADLATHLRDHPELDAEDVAYTLQIGRKTFPHRRIAVCRGGADGAEALAGGRALGRVDEATRRPVAFLFPGLGPQYVGMGRELYEREELFRAEIDRCSEIVLPLLGRDLRTLLLAGPAEQAAAAEQLRRIAVALPVLFAVEYSLARLWMSWGIEPRAMIGHSNGEYVAACLAGVFSLADALALVTARAALMEGLPAGAMLAVPLPRPEAEALLTGELSLALVNARDLCVLSGPSEAIDRLAERLAREGVDARRLQAGQAYHSAMMQPMMEPLAARVAAVERRAPRIPFVSNVTGTWIEAVEATDPEYWARHVRSTVRFAEGVDCLLADPDMVLLEVGPGAALGNLARRQSAGRIVLPSLRSHGEEGSDVEQTLLTLGRLWLAGAPVDWRGFHAGGARRRLHLPVYPFERRRYWIDRTTAVAPPARKPLSEWTYLPVWKRARPLTLLPELPQEGVRLLFLDSQGLGRELAAVLRARGRRVVTVEPGGELERLGPGAYCLDPAAPLDYRLLLAELAASGEAPRVIAHLWNVGPVGAGEPLEESQRRGFYSLLFLGQALSKLERELPEVELIAVSDRLHEVVSGDVVEPEKATVLGPVKVIAQELPHVRCRSVDLGVLPGSDLAMIAETLAGEIERRSDDEVVAGRGAHRWTRSFEAVPFARPDAPVLRPGGVYLITGGFGRLAQVVARHLAERYGARLALVGRSVPLHGSAAVLELERLGAEVLALAADVTDRGEMAGAVAAARARFGRIHGVIHTAGRMELELIGGKTAEQAARVLAPKVQGALVLSDLFRGEDLDYLVLFSSFASVTGGFGTVDYTAANAFLDALAWRNAEGGGWPRTVAIDWGHWRTEGDEKGAGQGGRAAREQLAAAIEPAEGLQVLEAVLARPQPQVLVSPRDLLLEISAIAALRREEEERSRTESRSSAPDPRPALDTPYVPPRDDLEEAIVAIWRELLGVERIGVRDNFYELGGHSLLATQVASRVRDTFRVEVPLAQMLAHPTVADLAAAITEQQAQGKGADLSRLVQEIQDLSEEELQRLLAAELSAPPAGEGAGLP